MSDETDLGFVTISELARLRGVDKSAISRRVGRLESQGLLTSRQGKGQTKLVNLAEFDRAARQATDAVRELNGRGSAPAAAAVSPGAMPGDPVLAREQARRAAYAADLAKLHLDERRGLLIPVDGVRDAMTACGQALARTIDQMQGRAEEMAAAVAKDGVQGARALFKTLSRELRDELARAMTLRAEADDEAPEPSEAEVEVEAA